jgi:hypothetical protein
VPGHERFHVLWEDGRESLLHSGEGIEVLRHTDRQINPIRHPEAWGPLWD